MMIVKFLAAADGRSDAFLTKKSRWEAKDWRIANCDGIRTLDNYLNELHDCGFPFLPFPKHHNSPPVAFIDCRDFVAFFWLVCVRGCGERERERERALYIYIVCVCKKEMASSITIGQAMANVSPACFTRLKNVDSLLLLREQVRRRSSRQSCFALVGFIKCANVSIIRTPPRRRPRSSGEKFDVCLVSRVRNAVISSSSELEQDMERAGLEGGKKQLLLGLQGGLNEDDIAGKRKPRAAAAAALVSLSAFSCLTTTGGASARDIVNVLANPAYGEVSALLEVSVQFIYLGALLALLGVGSFLVVRQVLIRRELESAAKELQDRVRSGEASSEEYFELGAVMLRKKFYVLANKYLEQAIKKWDGDEQDLAQVYNALGFSYFSDDKLDAGIAQYEKAVKLQPGYVTAWNNLADAYEKKKDFQRALKAYEEALQFDPSNKVANSRRSIVKERVERYEGIPSKSD